MTKRQLADAHNLFDSIPTGLLLLQKGMIVDANQTALDQLGYLSHEIIGSDFMNLVPSHLKPSVKKRHKACQVVRRRGRVYVINKKNPRFKARQG